MVPATHPSCPYRTTDEPRARDPHRGLSQGSPVGAPADGIEAQTHQALTNLAAILASAGASTDDLVKVTIFYSDVDDFGRINEIYATYMPDPPPARSAPANVKLPRGLLISIDAIAVLPAATRTT